MKVRKIRCRIVCAKQCAIISVKQERKEHPLEGSWHALFNLTPSYVVGSMITSCSADGGNWGMERLPEVMDQLVPGNAGSQTQGVWLQNLHSSHIPCPFVWIHVRICLYSHELSGSSCEKGVGGCISLYALFVHLPIGPCDVLSTNAFKKK